MFQVGDRVRIRSADDLFNEYGSRFIDKFSINSDMEEYQLGTVGIIASVDEGMGLPFLVKSPESELNYARKRGWWYSADELYKEEN